MKKIGIIILCWIPFILTMANDDRKDRLNHAINAPECGLDDGYQCLDILEDNFALPNKHRVLIPGNHLKVWLISWQDFQSIDDMDAEQKNLKHYKLSFTENRNQYIVLYQALLLPHIEDGQAVGVSRDILGRSTQYWINKKNLAIDKRLFYKF